MVALDYIVCRSLPFVSPSCRVRLQLSLLSDTRYSEARIISFFEFLVKITVRKLVNINSSILFTPHVFILLVGLYRLSLSFIHFVSRFSCVRLQLSLLSIPGTENQFVRISCEN